MESLCWVQSTGQITGRRQIRSSLKVPYLSHSEAQWDRYESWAWLLCCWSCTSRQHLRSYQNDIDLWQCAFMPIVLAWDQAARTMTWYPTQSHYPHSKLTNACFILLIQSAWLGSIKYQFLNDWFAWSRVRTPRYAKAHLVPWAYSLNRTWWPNRQSADFSCRKSGFQILAGSSQWLTKLLLITN